MDDTAAKCEGEIVDHLVFILGSVCICLELHPCCRWLKLIA